MCALCITPVWTSPSSRGPQNHWSIGLGLVKGSVIFQKIKVSVKTPQGDKVKGLYVFSIYSCGGY